MSTFTQSTSVNGYGSGVKKVREYIIAPELVEGATIRAPHFPVKFSHTAASKSDAVGELSIDSNWVGSGEIVPETQVSTVIEEAFAGTVEQGWHRVRVENARIDVLAVNSLDTNNPTAKAAVCRSVAYVPGDWPTENLQVSAAGAGATAATEQTATPTLQSEPATNSENSEFIDQPHPQQPTARFKKSLADSAIKASWQVDAFRWPKSAMRFSRRHEKLVAQIGESIWSQVDRVGNRIGVCGMGRHIGKSVVSTCVARWLSNKGKRVLLIDADVESATLTLFSGVEQKVSWLEGLAKREPIEESLIESVSENITLAAIRKTKINNLAQSAFEYLSRFSNLLSRQFDFVLIDVGDVNFLNQRSFLHNPVVDGAILVHQSEEAGADQIELAQLRMRNRGIKPLAIVRNFSELSAA